MRSLHHTYQDRTEVRAEGIPFRVMPGERVALIGATGTGKTTLLKHVLGLLHPGDGEVRVLGRDPYRDFGRLRQSVSVVFQNPDEQIIGPTVHDDIAFALRAQGQTQQQVADRVQAVAAQFGLTELLARVPHYLSGGQKQKVALAGAVATEPQLLVLDEPFSGLDGKSRREMVRLLSDLNRQRGTTLLLSTHDLELVPEIADRVYVLHHGHLALAGSPQQVLTEVDGLRAVDLEPPVLVQLFADLLADGLAVSLPIRLPAAKQQIKQLLGRPDVPAVQSPPAATTQR